MFYVCFSLSVDVFLSTVVVENPNLGILRRLGFDPLIKAFLSVLNLEEVVFFSSEFLCFCILLIILIR